AGDLVWDADDPGLGDGGVLHQGGLHLERPDEMARRLDHVVGAAHEPEVAVGVLLGEVAAQVPAAGEAPAVALLLAEVAPEHRRPWSADRQLALGEWAVFDHGLAAVVEHHLAGVV